MERGLEDAAGIKGPLTREGPCASYRLQAKFGVRAKTHSAGRRVLNRGLILPVEPTRSFYSDPIYPCDPGGPRVSMSLAGAPNLRI